MKFFMISEMNIVGELSKLRDYLFKQSAVYYCIKNYFILIATGQT